MHEFEFEFELGSVSVVRQESGNISGVVITVVTVRIRHGDYYRSSRIALQGFIMVFTMK
jgi:hypothetical protein